MGKSTDGKYLRPDAETFEGGITFEYTTFDESASVFKENTISDVSDLDALRTYVKSNLSSFGKSSLDGETNLDVLYVSSFVFFTKDGDYVDTVSIDTLNTWSKEVKPEDFKGKIGVKVTPVGKTSAEITVAYDFTSYPQSLGGEEIVNFAIMSKSEMESKGDTSEGSIEKTNYLDSSDSDEYMDEEMAVKGVTKAYSINKNGDYVVLLESTCNEYKKEFTVNNIATKSVVKGKAVLNGKAPKVTFSKLPKSIEKGKALEITMYTNKKSNMVFNGESTGIDNYVTKKTFKVYSNGTYYYSAQSKDGGIKTGTLKVNCFKDVGATGINMNDYYGDGTSTNGILPQTGLNVNMWWILFSFVSVILGVLILFRRRIKLTSVNVKNGIKKLFTYFLMLSLIVTSVSTGIISKKNTITVKANTDGTGYITVKGAYKGGGWDTEPCVGFGIKFSLRLRSDIVNHHTPKTQNVVYNTLYEEDINELYCTIAYNADGDVTWSGDKLGMLFLDGNKVKADRRFAAMNSDQFSSLFNIDASKFSRIMKASCNNKPKALEAEDFSDTCDEYFTDDSSKGEKRLYTYDGRKEFYKDFVKILKKELKDDYVEKWQKKVMSEEDFLEGGVLVVEPFAIYSESHPNVKGSVVGITYPAAAKIQQKKSVTHRQYQAYLGEYANIIGDGGNTAIYSCGGYLNGHGSKGCNYSPITGKYLSHKPCRAKNPDCEICADYKWSALYDKKSQLHGNIKYGWGIYGMPTDKDFTGKRSAVNLSVKTTYKGNGNFTVEKKESMVSAEEFEKVSTNVSSMTADVNAEKYYGRKALGSDNKKAHVLNLPSTQSAYYTGYEMTSCGAYVVDGENSYTYSNLSDVVHGYVDEDSEVYIDPVLPDICKSKKKNVSSSDLNMGVKYEPQYEKGETNLYNDPESTAYQTANNMGWVSDGTLWEVHTAL